MGLKFAQCLIFKICPKFYDKICGKFLIKICINFCLKNVPILGFEKLSEIFSQLRLLKIGTWLSMTSQMARSKLTSDRLDNTLARKSCETDAETNC
jgi:hypothetical protein